MLGIIALDIDGTIAFDRNIVPKNVRDYLGSLTHCGWCIFFVTGRPFFLAHQTLKEMHFPYYLAVQNGALILEMPSKRIITKKYLSPSILPEMDRICEGEPTDFIIYTGFEYEDRCYYRPKNFFPPLLNYLHDRTQSFNETWIQVESFIELNLSEFPSIKCFGYYQDAVRLKNKIEYSLNLHVPLVRDPFDSMFYVLQGTGLNIDKGNALKELIALKKEPCIIIAAGDDQNDRAMFDVSDIKIAMATAPQDMIEIADIIAPPASEEGIIAGLEQALHSL